MIAQFAAALLLACPGSGDVPPARSELPEPRVWTVAGERREALVFSPSKRIDAAPVVFVFHGHGGTMARMARKDFQTLWPEAVVVCPQGLPTVSPRDPEGRRAGWQLRSGQDEDRDLKFVDTMLKTLRADYAVDDRRIYAAGHSNGGVFVYLLWAAWPGREFAAVAPVAAVALALRGADRPKPLPILHLAGKADPIVPFEWQRRTMGAVRKLDGCDAEGRPWAAAGPLVGTIYPSTGGTPLVSLVHPGGHEFPDEAPRLIVKFFQEHAKP